MVSSRHTDNSATARSLTRQVDGVAAFTLNEMAESDGTQDRPHVFPELSESPRGRGSRCSQICGGRDESPSRPLSVAAVPTTWWSGDRARGCQLISRLALPGGGTSSPRCLERHHVWGREQEAAPIKWKCRDDGARAGSSRYRDGRRRGAVARSIGGNELEASFLEDAVSAGGQHDVVGGRALSVYQ